MNALVTTDNTFQLMQREAKLFAMSPLVPQHLRQGSPEQALANCYIALHMARAMDENPLLVMQNIYIVSGKAGWSAQYIIARANRSGVFKGRINWRKIGSGDSLEVTAYAHLADSGEEVSATVSMAMAKAEGWTKNSKYQTMGEHMLRYRSATMLVRLFAPEVMMGYQTVDEIEDVDTAGREVTRRVDRHSDGVPPRRGEVIDITPERAAADLPTADEAVDALFSGDDIPFADQSSDAESLAVETAEPAAEDAGTEAASAEAQPNRDAHYQYANDKWTEIHNVELVIDLDKLEKKSASVRAKMREQGSSDLAEQIEKAIEDRRAELTGGAA